MGYIETKVILRNGLYSPAAVLNSKSLISDRDGSLHVFNSGYFSTTDCPRYEIALTSSSTFTGSFTGRNPCELYSSATSDPSGSGSGRNSPVSLFDRASSLCVEASTRNRFETPVAYDDPYR